EVLAGHVEVVGAGGLARFVGRVFGGGAVLAVVDPVGLAVGPESRDPVPPLVVALPVAVDPEPARGRDAPGAGDPDEVLAALVPLPVALDPLRPRVGRVDARAFDDRRGRGLGDVDRLTVLGRREERLVERPFVEWPDGAVVGRRRRELLRRLP